MAPSMSDIPGTLLATPDDHRAYIVVVSVILLIWTLLAWLLRITIRLRFNGPWGLDDTVVSLGTVFAIVQSSLIYKAVAYGLGKRMELISSSELVSLEKYLYVSQIFYVLAVSLSKISTAYLMSRLTRSKHFTWIAHGIGIFSAVWMIISALIISVRCVGTSPWDLTGRHCAADPWDRWLAIEVVFAVIEFALFVFSIALVWGLQMSMTYKTVVVGAFICRLFVIVTIAVRLVYLRPQYFLEDATFNSVNAGILTQVCMHYSLMAATIPCTRPFIKAFYGGYLDNQDVATTGYSGSKSMDHSGYQLHSISSGRNKGQDGTRPSRPTINIDSLTRNLSHKTSTSPSTTTPLDLSPGGGKGLSTTLDLTTSNNPRSNAWPITTNSINAVNGNSNLESMLRPDFGEVITTVEHDPRAIAASNVSRDGSDGSALVMDDGRSDEMIIRQTRDWEVTYERTN